MNQKVFSSLKEEQIIINETDGDVLLIKKRNNNHLYCESVIRQFKIVRQENIDIPMDHCDKWEVYEPYKVENQKLLNLILLKEIGMIKLYIAHNLDWQGKSFHTLTHLI